MFVRDDIGARIVFDAIDRRDAFAALGDEFLNFFALVGDGITEAIQEIVGITKG